MSRLLIVIGSATFGGAEMYALTLCEGVRARGWEPVLAAPLLPGLAGLRERAAALGVRVEPCDVHEPFVPRPQGVDAEAWWRWATTRWPVREPLIAWRMRELLARVRPDIVHVNAHFGTRGGVPALEAARAGYPTVLVFQLAEGHAAAGDRVRRLYRRGVRAGAHWIAVTSADRESLVRTMEVPEERVHLVHNSVDLERPAPGPEVREKLRRELGAEAGARVLLTVGRLSGQKGYPALLEALRAVCARHPEARAWWVGEGELREELSRAVAADGLLSSRVRLLGFRDDVRALLSAADAFVLPSVYEGLPFSLLEAMAAGLPCVSTTIPGVREVATDGENALLVPPGDAGALATAVSRVLDDGALAKRLSEAGRERAKAFDRRAMIEKTCAIYEQALRQKK